jgi:hypothetical protein
MSVLVLIMSWVPLRKSTLNATQVQIAIDTDVPLNTCTHTYMYTWTHTHQKQAKDLFTRINVTCLPFVQRLKGQW